MSTDRREIEKDLGEGAGRSSPDPTALIWRARRLATSRWALPIVIGIAFLARIGVQIAIGFYDHPERWEYDDLVLSVLRGDGYSIEHLGTTYRAFSLPGYTAILVAVYSLFGRSAIAIGIFQALLGGALTWCVWAIARRVGLEASAGLAALIAATHPGLVVYSTKVHPLNIDALLPCILIWLLVQLERGPTRWTPLALGLTSAAAMLERPTYLPIVATGLVYVACVTGRWRRMLINALVVASLVCLAALPWVIRNVREVGQPVMSTSGGEVFWRGNNPGASGGSLTNKGRAILDADPAFRARIFGRPEAEQNAAFLNAAWAYIRAEPAAAVKRSAAKLAMFWWFGPTAGIFYPLAWLRGYGVYYVALMTFALIGAANLLRRSQATIVFHVTMLSLFVSVQHALVYVEGRHRWGIEAPIGILSAVGIGVVSRKVSRSPREARSSKGDEPALTAGAAPDGGRTARTVLSTRRV